jgi:hypothetical protein
LRLIDRQAIHAARELEKFRSRPYAAVMEKTPPHDVWKSKLANLAWLINKAIDNGNYELDLATVQKAVFESRAFQLMKDELPTHHLLDFSIFSKDDEQAINDWFECSDFQGHVEKNGLCLLLALTIGMLQEAWDAEDLPAGTAEESSL